MTGQFRTAAKLFAFSALTFSETGGKDQCKERRRRSAESAKKETGQAPWQAPSLRQKTTFQPLRHSSWRDRQLAYLADDRRPLYAVEPRDKRHQLGDEFVGHEIAHFVLTRADAAAQQVG